MTFTCLCCFEFPPVVLNLFVTGVVVFFSCSKFLSPRVRSKFVRRSLFALSCSLSLSLLVLSLTLLILSNNPSLRSRSFASLCGILSKPSPLDEFRCRALQGVEGKVLELGPGPGTNFRCVAGQSGGAIRAWTGLDVNLHFAPAFALEASRRNLSFPVDALWFGAAEPLPAALVGAFDSLVATHVLCSVESHRVALANVAAALKVGGKYHFMEHVAAREGTPLRAVQSLLQSLVTIVADGCSFKNIREEVEGALGEDFDIAFEEFDAPMPIPPFRPHVMGVATKLR